jgi:hypothetical protein
MRIRTFSILASLALLCTPGTYARIDPSGADAPPEIIAQARALVAKKDYVGIEALVTQVDARFGNNHSPDYFRSLIAVENAFPNVIDPTKLDLTAFQEIRKLQWKILLTPYSQPENAGEVLEVKNLISAFGVPFPFYSFERDRGQYQALRLDAAALLIAYGKSLRAKIIPDYQPKPERFRGSVAIFDPKYAAEWAAEKKRLEPILKSNEIENREQDALREALRWLNGNVVSLIEDAFSWPPEDDQAVNALLAAFPLTPEEQQKLEKTLAQARASQLAELQKMQSRTTPVPPAKP